MSVHYADDRLTLLHGDALSETAALAEGSVQTVVTSPPYFGLRDYGTSGQYGNEPTVLAYVEQLVALFREVRRVLADDGTLWLNLGDSYASDPGAGRGSGSALQGRKHDQAQMPSPTTRGTKQGVTVSRKNLLGIPWRVAFALQDDGWVLRSDIVWAKPNAMPESVADRPTRSHEYLFLLAKQPRYFYDAEAIKEPGTGLSSGNGFDRPEQINRGGSGSAQRWDGTSRVNKRDVWTVPTVPFSAAHFATFPPALVRPCVLAGSRPRDMVLDPFSGSGTTGAVALEQSRRYVGIDINADYLDLSLRERFTDQPLDLYGASA